MNSFHAWMKPKTPVATRPGASSGKVTFQKAPALEQRERGREGDPHGREHRPDGAALELAQHDAGRRGHETSEAHPLEQGRAVGQRRLRTHRLRGRQPQRPPHGAPGAGERCEGGDADAAQDVCQTRLEGQLRQPVVRRVETRQRGSDRAAEQDPAQHARRDDQTDQAGVMAGHLAVAVSEGLERPDLLALATDDASDDDVQEEGRHRQEEGRHAQGVRSQLGELVLEEESRLLVGACDGSQSAVALEDAVHACEHGGDVGVRRDAQRDVVERALEVEGRCEGPAGHPEHAEATVVGDQGPRTQGVGVLRRERRPDDAQHFVPAVQDGAQPRVLVQATGLGERFAHEHLAPAPGPRTRAGS